MSTLGPSALGPRPSQLAVIQGRDIGKNVADLLAAECRQQLVVRVVLVVDALPAQVLVNLPPEVLRVLPGDHGYGLIFLAHAVRPVAGAALAFVDALSLGRVPLWLGDLHDPL